MLKVTGVFRGYEAKEKVNNDGTVSIKNKLVVETEGFKILKIGVKDNQLKALKPELTAGKPIELPVTVGSYKDFIYYTYAG